MRERSIDHSKSKAIRFMQLLFQSRAVGEIGFDTAWLVIAVAAAPEQKFSGSPSSFFTAQLLLSGGFRSAEQLERARQAATDAGWLRYEAGPVESCGRYWPTVPDKVAVQADLLPAGGDSNG